MMSPHRVEPEQSDMETEQNDVETSENNIDTSDEEPNSEGRETTNKESTDDIQGPRCPVFCLTEPTDAVYLSLKKLL